MPDRLSQLRRQRALVQEQLEWINREIASAEAGGEVSPAPVARSVALQNAAAAPAASPPTTATTAVEEDIIARYRVGSDTLKHDVKKGCAIYFSAALLLLAAVVVILYFSLRSR